MPLCSVLRVYFENSIGQLAEHPDEYIVVRYRAGKRELGDFKAFLQHLGQALWLRGWYKMFADHRALAPFTDDERQWMNEHWLAESQARQREMLAAVLLPEDEFARLSMSMVMHDAREGALRYHIFSSEKEATQWLQNN